MRQVNFLILLGLIVILTSSYSIYYPVPEDQIQEVFIANVNETSDVQAAINQQPVSPVAVPDVSEFDPNAILIYIKEQCYAAGVDYRFAVSLLREENPSFFRLHEGSVRQELVFEACNKNDNGSTGYGLWQLNGNNLWKNFIPDFWHDLYEFDWKNPYHNTFIAIRYINSLYTALEKVSNERGAPQTANTLYWETAMAYNAGLDRIQNKHTPSAKTLDYAARIAERIYY